MIMKLLKKHNNTSQLSIKKILLELGQYFVEIVKEIKDIK